MPDLNPAIAAIPIPEPMRALPIGPNGFPVPWFSAWVDGRPEFRVADHRKFGLAVRERRCWACGTALAKNLTFAAGPMCGINRTSSEPPSHHACAVYSALACPFLARPHMERREGGLEELGTECPAGHMLRRNPGVVLLWTTRAYSLFDDGRGGTLVRMGDPLKLEWYSQGRRATRAEVAESVRSGLPALEAVARQQPGAMKALRKMTRDFERLWPKA